MRARLVGFVWNARTARPRLPWRLLAVVAVVAGLAAGVTALADSLLTAAESGLGLVLTGPEASAAAGNLVFVAVQLLVYVGSVALVGRYVDRRRFRDFGMRIDRDWWVDLGFGIGLGAALMTGVFAVEYAAGWVVVTGTFRIAQPGFGFWPWFGWATVTFAGVGLSEELLTRGYLIKNVAEGLTWFDRIEPRASAGLAVVCSAGLFAAGHAANPNAGLASTVGIAVAAVMLAAGYVLTGELAVPIGLHTTWNLFQGPVFGFPVSGLDLGLSAVAVEQGGPALVTGGSFGPEAGLLGIAASLLGTGLVLLWVRGRRGRLRVHPSLVTPERRPSEPSRTGAEP